MNAQLQNYAPGARLVIRDTEWILRRVDLSSDGGYQLTCDGISELVRGQSSMFLTQIEDDIQVLDPARTNLVKCLVSGLRMRGDCHECMLPVRNFS